MESIKKLLQQREKEIINYEKKFNILKSKINYIDNNDNNTVNFLDLNYKLDDYMANFVYNKNIRVNKNVEILKKELENFSYKQIKIRKFENIVNYLFNRYNPIVREYVEDNWISYNYEKQNKYELKNNEFVYDNSILRINKEEDNVQFFLKNMFKILKQMGKQHNYKVYTKFYDDSYHEITWLIFVFSKNVENSN